MDFLDPYVVTRTADLVPLDEVRRLEAELGVELPDDYARAMSTLGKGGWCHEVGLLDPAQLTGRLAQHRQMMTDYWFWDDAVISQADAVRSVPVADSYNGDALVLVDGRLTWLPRDTEVALDAGTTCQRALEVLFDSGAVYTRPTIAWFAAYTGDNQSQNREGGDHEATLAAVRAAFPDAPVDVDLVQPAAAVVLLREIGGFVKLDTYDGTSRAHVDRDGTLTEAWARLDAVLAAAGCVPPGPG